MVTRHLFPDDTIVATATPAGRGGIGIIRISGKMAFNIAYQVVNETNTDFKPGTVYIKNFYVANTPVPDEASPSPKVVDEGIILFFKGPRSFTGEDVVEFHSHGSPVVLNTLVDEIVRLGARTAQAGEFTQRAFLSGRMDLVQSEAVADLIESNSRLAAQSAIATMKGAFSERVNAIGQQLIELRTISEAALDFAEEEIDFLSDKQVEEKINTINDDLTLLIKSTHSGVLLQEGFSLIISGKPNSGKSSLFNYLCGHDRAIVTDIPGTTRDLLKEIVSINDLSLAITDTAGLRHTKDTIEAEGVQRVKAAVMEANHIFLLIDSAEETLPPKSIVKQWQELCDAQASPKHITLVYNKIDLSNSPPGLILHSSGYTCAYVSLLTGAGMEDLTKHIVDVAKLNNLPGEGLFIARRRHLDALHDTQAHLKLATEHIKNTATAELVAEELKLAHNALGEITGEFTNEDLLERIFSSFCIGK